jgi:Ca2+-transporting ATPase
MPSELTGLTSLEAAKRLKRFGPNELPDRTKRALVRIILDVLREPMFLLLVSAAGIYLVLGDLAEGFVLAGFAVFNVGLVVTQERRSERVLQALRDFSSPRAVVIRDGVQRRIAGRELVRSDLVVLTDGDRVPADGVVLRCKSLAVDESMLTGESVPVRKIAGEATNEHRAPGGDDLPFVYSGSLVVGGHGLALVTATGTATEIGRIGRSLATIETEPTLLQRNTARLVRTFAAIGIGLSLALILLHGLTRGLWYEGVLAGVALAMATLPEEFPMVLIVFLALGAWRLSRQQVLSRRPAVIETLGAASILCVDKTGTLTENRMTVRALYADGQMLDVAADAHSLPEPFHAVLEFAILASRPQTVDPMELAMLGLGASTLARTEHLHPAWTLVHEYELQPGFLATTLIWSDRSETHIDQGAPQTVAAKGAPEAIADLRLLRLNHPAV